MGFAAAVNLGVTAPAFITLGVDATVTKKTTREEVVWVHAMGPEGKHGQSKVKRIKHTIRAEGEGSATKNSTEAGTSEATAMVDNLRSGQENEKYDGWSAEGHWYTDS